jgi:small-conductance mechanosensitive channel
MRLTIEEYARQYKMSKELVTSKLRSKKLNYIIENETVYIILPQDSIFQEPKQPQQHQIQKTDTTSTKVTVGMILSLYKQENERLKQKIEILEKKIDSLISDKESMLREERDRIEQLYSSKDEQLKTILELMNKKFMLEQQSATVHDVTPNNEPQEAPTQTFVELKSYLKSLNLESYQRKILKKRFFDLVDNDVRILQYNDRIYLDFAKYDYSDLLKI